MIDALIAGKIHGTPTQRTGQSGKPFVTASVRTPTANGDSLFVSVIAFDPKVRDALLVLDDGDSVSLSGTLTPKVWTDKQGQAKPSCDLVAHAMLTAYHVTRKRKAVVAEAEPVADVGFNGETRGGFEDFSDDEPF